MTDRDAATRIVDLYQRHAAVYDRVRSRALFEKTWLDRFIALLPPGGSVLDLGCGCGEPIASYMVANGFAVTGIDSASAMTDLCRERLPGTWITADMRTLSLGTRFDGLIAWDSFFHLSHDDQRAMFGVFEAHAAGDAALMFTSGPAYGEAIGTFESEPLYHASLDGEEYRTLLGAHGFTVAKQINEDTECEGHTIWLARKGERKT